MTIQEIKKKYIGKLDHLDVELLIAHSLGKTREFVLIHPEYEMTSHQSLIIGKLIKRRMEGEPVAYLVGHKEFYGLDFQVDKHTLIPRPETELIVEQVLDLLRSMLRSNVTIIDVGTGSGCIITSITHELEKNKKSRVIPDLIRNTERDIVPDSHFHGNDNIEYFATDISKGALKIARKNAKIHGVDNKIKFLHGNLLEPFIKKHWSLVTGHKSLVITANLPYLSEEIYESAPIDVRKYEPKTALYSSEQGLWHYRKLLEQLKQLLVTGHWSLVTVMLEISPEQKMPLARLVKSILPASKATLAKDLAGKWRICKITIDN